MNQKVIISVAPVAGPDPLIPELLAEDVARCVEAGASMCHLHAKTRKGPLTPDISNISEAFDQILERCDIVVQVSTGGISDMNIQERCHPLAYHRAESASLNGGSTNLGEAIYCNSFEDIRYCAKACYERDIIPEIEVFDIGMLHNMELMKQAQAMHEPMLFNLVFGHKGGMQPSIEALVAFRSFVPKDSLWGVTHYGRDNWWFLAAAIAMGASLVRIGFEDSRYLAAETVATSNEELVKKLVDIVHSMEKQVATPDEVREILKIRKR